MPAQPPGPQLPAEGQRIVGALSIYADWADGRVNEFTENSPTWGELHSIHGAFKEASEAMFIFDSVLLYNSK